MKASVVSFDVYTAFDFLAVDGVTKGDALSFADELVMDDVFVLRGDAKAKNIQVCSTAEGLFLDAARGPTVHIDSCLTFMAPDGSTHELLVLVKLEDDQVAETFAFPLGTIMVQIEYRLVGIERHTATRRFAETSAGSFAKGTHITMHDGLMRRVETLQPGEFVLTRDAGKQAIRWIGQATVRARGAFAPVVIEKGALHNEETLVVQPDHRLFVYQRDDKLGAGRPEVLIKARHLVDGQSITIKEGGFIDYYQLVFDEHQIIFAEGIAAETHLIDERTRHALPEHQQSRRHGEAAHLTYEIAEKLIPHEATAALLRAASAR